MIKHKNSLYVWYLSWNVYHMFIYQCKMLKLFLGMFIYFTRFIKIFLTCFSDPVSDPDCGWQARSVDRTMGRSTFVVDRRAQPCARLADTDSADRPVDRSRELLLSVSGRSTERSTGSESPALCIWAVDRTVDRELQRSDFWPLAVDRLVDRRSVRLTDQPND